MFNLNKALELTLNEGKCLLTGEQIGLNLGKLEDYKTFEDLEEAFRKQIDYFIDEMMKAEVVVEKAHQDCLPSAFLSTVIDDCLEKGLDVTRGGAKYNLSGIQMMVEKAHQDCLPSAFLSTVIDDCLEKGLDVTRGGAKYNLSGIQMIQVANLADSLAAIKELVYDEEMISKEELLQALRDDFKGHEITQTMLLNKAPKYGNDVKWVDDLGTKWAGYFRERMKDYTNYRGGGRIF